MTLGIKGKFIVGFDSEEYRILTYVGVAIEGNRITHVIVDGRIFVEDENVLTINEEQRLKQVQHAAEWIWNRIPEYNT